MVDRNFKTDFNDMADQIWRKNLIKLFDFDFSGKIGVIWFEKKSLFSNQL